MATPFKVTEFTESNTYIRSTKQVIVADFNGDTIKAQITNLSAKEHSGIELKNLTTKALYTWMWL